MAFGSFEVLAGDFKKGNDHQFISSWSSYLLMKNDGKFLREKIYVAEVAELEVALEQNVKRIGGTAGWGIAGNVFAGPAGLLVGLLVGGACRNHHPRNRLAAGIAREVGRTVPMHWVGWAR